jgi:pyrroline-5-carboxylate reductase
VNRPQSERHPVTAILGAGVMGETVLSGLLRSGRSAASVVVGEKRADRARELQERYDVRVLGNLDAVRAADTVLLVVKPQDVEVLLAEVGPALREGQLVVSLAAGLTTAWIEARVPGGVAVVRVMPNTPALVDQGMAVVSAGSRCTEEQVAEAESLLSGTGRVLRVPESQQDAATAVSGSGPAYVFLVVEAMVEAGVHLGLPRPTATELAVQTVLGAATMVSETGTHPGLLREQVTSPGGTTAAALGELERHGLRAAFLDALAAARDRSRELAGDP